MACFSKQQIMHLQLSI
uniref:Uncharacterized protein n=1 Tax=Anguilla anguilla TaxID=7936 RepID=A0A0E9URP4_ANGAN